MFIIKILAWYMGGIYISKWTRGWVTSFVKIGNVLDFGCWSSKRDKL